MTDISVRPDFSGLPPSVLHGLIHLTNNAAALLTLISGLGIVVSLIALGANVVGSVTVNEGQSIAIPGSALFQKDGKPAVWLVTKDATVQLKPITVERYQGNSVVVGSGLGGLTSAALLARAGKSVLIVERNDRTGGYAHAFRRRYGLAPAGFRQVARKNATHRRAATPSPGRS